MIKYLIMKIANKKMMGMNTPLAHLSVASTTPGKIKSTKGCNLPFVLSVVIASSVHYQVRKFWEIFGKINNAKWRMSVAWPTVALFCGISNLFQMKLNRDWCGFYNIYWHNNPVASNGLVSKLNWKRIYFRCVRPKSEICDFS